MLKVHVKENQASKSKNAARALGCHLYRTVARPIAGVMLLLGFPGVRLEGSIMLSGVPLSFSGAFG